MNQGAAENVTPQTYMLKKNEDRIAQLHCNHELHV
jgi:hypothetical protein